MSSQSSADFEATTPCPAKSPLLQQFPCKTLAAALLQGCNDLLSELTAFQSHLSKLGKPNGVEFRQFKSVIQSELRSLQKLSEQVEVAAAESEAQRRGYSDSHGKIYNENDGGDYEDVDEDQELSDTEARLLHSLRSSNLPFYATVWNVSKTMCKNLVAFTRRFYWHERKGRNRLCATGQEDMVTHERYFRNLEIPDERATKKKPVGTENAADESLVKKSVLVDIVADNGEEWVKVSTVTPNRLLFELAKLGWEAGDSTSELEEEDGFHNIRLQHDDDGDDSDDMVELVKLAVDLKKAAAMVRVRYKHPRIRFILPKIVEGQFPEVDKILQDIRKIGVVVECGTGSNDLFDNLAAGKPITRPLTPVPLEEVLPSILPNPYAHRTNILNVDCTLLLALVSDISHIRDIDPSPSHHRAITRQIELEAKQPLVPSELWPAMGDKDLVCTADAKERMQEIVDTIGTETEKARTKLLLGEVDGVVDRAALLSQFQQLSDHRVPMDWKIPIRVVDARAEIQKAKEEGRLPKVARVIESQLSDINTSVFFYGWASGLMTISSNRTVVKQIEALVEANRNGDDDLAGPNVWVCDTARSLVGKEHNKRY
ncbi:hypothetical protein VTO42DRAFT_1575 [Malbranchea cinnamomea]